jgi:SAM-dependent methyltransferase
MKPEFDGYGQDYRRLLQHPIRDRFAPSADYFARRKLEVIRAFFNSRNIATRELRWLDVGCGQGDLLRIGRSEFGEIAGCDPSAEMLRQCGDLPVRVQASAAELPYQDETFDLVTLVCVLHHVTPGDRLALVRAISAALRPGGWLCVVEHNPWNPVTQYIVRRSPVDQGAVLMSAGATARLLRDAGYECFERRHFLVVPERLRATFGGWEELLSGLPLGGQYAIFARRAGEAHHLVARPAEANSWAESTDQVGPRSAHRKS